MKELRMKIRYFATIFISDVLKLFWLFPINSNKILFISFSGKEYSDSPLFISNAIIGESNKTIVWAMNKASIIKDNAIKVVPAKGLQFIREFVTSGTVITNNMIESFMPVRKKQIILNTWHGGGPGKTIGFRDNIVDPYLKYYTRLQNKKTTAILSGSAFCTNEVMHESLGFDFSKIIETGLPRNDLFFKINNEIRKKVFADFGISGKENTAIILYAPTFRGSSQNGDFIEPENYPPLKEIAEILNKKTGKEYYILFRAHYAMKIKEIAGTISASNYPNMQELLYASDVLVTDYSSCMHDFSLMRKLVLLYVPDYDEYMSKRGFYRGIYNTPFPIAKTKEELITATNTFDMRQYVLNVDNYLDELGNVECGESTQHVIDWLKKQWGERWDI